LKSRSAGRALAEREHEAVAVADHELPLPVDAVLRLVEDLGAARAELRGQRVDAGDVDVRGVAAVDGASVTRSPSQ
jgi:hypothetical protein